jgi:3-hydroxyacyl-[acyl-carrier-protein] dehydratase
MLNNEANKGKLALFAGIDKCRFKKQVTPGDTLRLEVEITKMKGPIGKGNAKATVDGQVACSCELTFALQDSK